MALSVLLDFILLAFQEHVLCFKKWALVSSFQLPNLAEAEGGKA